MKPEPERQPYRWPATYVIFFLIGLAVLAIRSMSDLLILHSSLLYIAIPFLIAVALTEFTEEPDDLTAWSRYLRAMRNSTIVMLASSVILFEGFICVLMFMPIYYLFATLGYWIAASSERRYKRRHMGVHTLPVIILAMSVEGTLPELSFERQASVTQIEIVDADIATLKANMAQPIQLDGPRHWFLWLFPLPHTVEAGTLEEGDVHVAKFEYRRWVVTNTHHGEVHLRIDEVSQRRVRTSIVRNDSYLAGYMDIDGTQVDFTPLPDGRTKVALTVHYERKLDPAWYFGPMQRFAMEKSAQYLIEQVIAR